MAPFLLCRPLQRRLGSGRGSQGVSYLRLDGLVSFASPLIAVTPFTVGLILLSGGFDGIFNPRLRTR